MKKTRTRESNPTRRPLSARALSAVIGGDRGGPDPDDDVVSIGAITTNPRG